jgi:hypothetical protein
VLPIVAETLATTPIAKSGLPDSAYKSTLFVFVESSTTLIGIVGGIMNM